jgi:hypothetical protein
MTKQTATEILWCPGNKFRFIDCKKLKDLRCYNNRIKLLINFEETIIRGLFYNKIKDYSKYITICFPNNKNNKYLHTMFYY